MSQHLDARISNPSPQVQVVEATLLVSDAVDPEADRLELLDTTLKRLGVQAPKLQTVTLCDERARGVNGQTLGIDGGAFLG